MSQLFNEVTVQTNDTHAEVVATPVVAAPASTKDAGRVKVGGVAIRFKSATASTKDAGRVRVGGVAIRF